ncbi:MAG: glycosyltransferase, partial [Methylocystis sp.]|nr:glycosyltransferase [Methylocystis sp.]
MEAGERYKGVDEILDLTPRLAARFPDFAYLVVGGGDDRARLEEKAARLGVGAHVVFTGEVSDAAKPAHYLLADLFAMPSMGEGFGIVLIEAAACGVPVLGGALDGSREALLDGALGVLVDPRCADSLYAALESALAAPAAPRRKNGVEHYSWDAFRTRVADWLETVVRK